VLIYEQHKEEAGMRLYFGHPITLYGKELETFLLTTIKEAFPDAVIVNPADKEHGDGYERFKAETGNGMRYFEEEVLPSCNGGVFIAFRDGKWGAGVFKELDFFHERGLSIWEIDVRGIITVLDGPFEAIRSRTLSVPETRLRIRDGKGNPLPF